MQYPPHQRPSSLFSTVWVPTYEVYSDILRGGCTFLPILVRNICSVVVSWLVGVSGFLEAMCLYVSGIGKSWVPVIEGWLRDFACCDVVFGHSFLGWDMTKVVHISWLLSPFLIRFCHHVDGHGYQCSRVRIFVFCRCLFRSLVLVCGFLYSW